MGQDGTRAPEGALDMRAQAPGAGRAVLVVEDEPNISEAIRFILHRDGWAVTVLDSGEHAADMVRTLQPVAMILDVMLPGLSGFEVLRGLRADPETRGLPVILLTARGQSAARTLAAESGASLFMAKPFANRDLLEAVRGLVDADSRGHADGLARGAEGP